jgi:L-ascorbate metabolism protein UlaG (beta-lactamase superfamily)
LQGPALIKDIDDCRLSSNQGAFWWLGQHGFAVKLGRKVLYIDAFLSEHHDRLIPPLFRPQEISNADYILGSHDHADHIDRDAWPVLAANLPKTRFVVPALLKENLSSELGIAEDRIVGLDDLTFFDDGEIRITGIAASHELLDKDPQAGLYPYLGFVVEGNGRSLYHSGDSCIYEGLQTKLKRWKLDAMFLPINGRDAKRLSSGCIGNMTYQEAADLAGALSPGLVIPAHYDMFAHNGGNPKLFLGYISVKYPAIKAKLCRHGKREMF